MPTAAVRPPWLMATLVAPASTRSTGGRRRLDRESMSHRTARPCRLMATPLVPSPSDMKESIGLFSENPPRPDPPATLQARTDPSDPAITMLPPRDNVKPVGAF